MVSSWNITSIPPERISLMSVSNQNNSEDAGRNDSSEREREAAAQPGNQPVQKNSQMADKRAGLDDSDFTPKLSQVKSKHAEESNQDGGALFICDQPFSADLLDVDMQEFGFHKDIHLPEVFNLSVTSDVPSAQDRYQTHLDQIQAPQAQPARDNAREPRQDDSPNERPEIVGSRDGVTQPPTGDAVVANIEALGSPHTKEAIRKNAIESQTETAPNIAIGSNNQPVLPVAEGILAIADDARVLFVEDQDERQRIAKIRKSLYWILEDERLVTHGEFSDFEPSEEDGENGRSNAFEMYDPDALKPEPSLPVEHATMAGATVDESVPKPALNVSSHVKLADSVVTAPPDSRPLVDDSVVKPMIDFDRVEDARRTTYEGKQKAIADAKKEKLRKTLISVGSFVLVCVASVVITYDTIVVKKPSDTKTESNVEETDREEKTEDPKVAPQSKATTKSASVKDELKKAFAQEQKKNYIKALEHFDVVLQDEANSKNTKALHGRGRVLTKLQRYDRALEDLETASDLDKGNELILIDLAAVKYLLADYSGSAREYERILSAHKNDVDALYGRGISYAALGQNDEAIADFEKIVKLKPGYDRAYRQMCTTFLAMNQPDKAEAAITVAMKACGTDADMYFSRGLARYQMGHKDEAIEDYNEAIREEPKRKEYYNDRGYVLMELGRIEDAKKDFRQALEIDPHYKLAVDNLARIDKLRKKQGSK